MSAGPQSSNNPFRRAGNAAAGAPALTPNLTPPARPAVFDAENAVNSPADADPAPPKQKTKVVKRVRVQTPPPLSSDSESDSPAGTESPVGRGWDTQDPFEGSRDEDPPAEAGPPHRNPFSKTLYDLEPGMNHSEPKPARAAGRASLDVAAFSRLLLTGQPGANGAPLGGTHTYTASPDAGSESSSPLPGRSATDPAPSDASPLLQAEQAAPATAPKKKPPPPSSRHGRAIRLQLGGDGAAQPPPLARTPSDFNKPLPPAPSRSPEEEDAESVFDREAAGRVPEGPPSPAVSLEARRITPAPPPRRGGREDGRGTAVQVEVQRRGSVESTHSRPESLRQAAPAPPPPRRPAHRSSGSITSPSSQSFSTPPTPLAAPDAALPSSPGGSGVDATTLKLAPPPPPPTRNASTRRRANNSVDGGNRRVGKEREGAPRPPPRRQRGGSRGSVESLTESLTERRGEVGTVREEEEGQAGVILADLDALRREVDALQKQYAGASQKGE